MARTEVEEIENRIAERKGELEALRRGIQDVHAEDFRAKFKMDIRNLEKAIEKDEILLKGLKDG